MHDNEVRSIETRAARGSCLALATLVAGLVSACNGHIEGNAEQGPGLGDKTPPGAGGTSGDLKPPVTSLPEASACRTSSPGPRALRRLTGLEYEATLRDLFGDPAVPVTAVFSDPSVLGFTVDTHALVIQGL